MRIRTNLYYNSNSKIMTKRKLITLDQKVIEIMTKQAVSEGTCFKHLAQRILIEKSKEYGTNNL